MRQERTYAARAQMYGQEYADELRKRDAEKDARKAHNKALDKLIPIAAHVTVTNAQREEVEVEVLGAKVTGYVNCVNALLEKCGYRPVRITCNMLNAQSRHWCVDINTPSYLDPGCEAYHSM